MRISLFELPAFDAETHGSSTELYQHILELAEFGDRIGLDSIWIAEHHLTDYGGSIPCVSILLAAIAQRTARIKLASGGVAVPLHRPLELAEQLAMVDAISGGRLRIGFVRAFLAHEFDAYNIDMNESRDRFNEGVDVILGLWAGEPFSYAGRYSRLNEVRLTPTTVQRPHPPITIGSIMTKESFEYAGARGYDIMLVPYITGIEGMCKVMQWYFEALDRGGHARSERNVMGQFFYYCHEDEATARADAGPVMMKYLGYIHRAVMADRWSKDYPGYEGLAQKVEALMDFDLLYKDRLLIGTPERIVERIEALAAIGLTEVALMPNVPGMSRAKQWRSLELLRDRVLPALAARPRLRVRA